VSVIVKWFVPEVGTSDALRLRAAGNELHAPGFFEIEFGNIVWKKLQRLEISRVDADDMLRQVTTVPVIRHSDGALIPAAFDLAVQTKRTVYDCLYLALAIQLGGVMVTADDRLANSLSATPWASNIIRLQDAP
jgi:predicted nucleic acid-binding protein